MIDDKTFYLLWGEALNADDRDTYVSEWSTSSIWPEDGDLLEIAGKLGQIWDVAHMSVNDICKIAGMTQAAVKERFCIKRRTMEDWCRGRREPPDHDRLMMAEILGIIVR